MFSGTRDPRFGDEATVLSASSVSCRWSTIYSSISVGRWGAGIMVSAGRCCIRSGAWPTAPEAAVPLSHALPVWHPQRTWSCTGIHMGPVRNQTFRCNNLNRVEFPIGGSQTAYPIGYLDCRNDFVSCPFHLGILAAAYGRKKELRSRLISVPLIQGPGIGRKLMPPPQIREPFCYPLQVLPLFNGLGFSCLRVRCTKFPR